jgi:hypothetical protein
VAHVSAVRSAPVPAAVAAAAQAAVPPARRSDALAVARRLSARAVNEWAPRLAWRLGRTGRTGLAGLALLVASALFLVSTQLEIAGQVEQLRDDLAGARARAVHAPPVAQTDPVSSLRALPTRGSMPAVLGVLLKQADAAHLSLDTGKYEMTASKAGAIVRYKLSFPVTGPYPQVRQFIDSTLKEMPMVAISELAIERKTIAEGAVEAQIRMTVYTRASP